jgi:DNA-binding response OmpR family regulator
MKILLVEDEPALLTTTRRYLETEGYAVTTAASFRVASEKANDYDYDCVVVDIGLPDGTGLDLIRQLKKDQSAAGIIVISARNSLDDKLLGLELGSDDYLTKPFHLPELNARIKSVLRRRLYGGNAYLQAGVLTLDPLTQRVWVHQQPVELTGKEFQLLAFFVANPDRLLSKGVLAEAIWGDHMDLASSHDFLYTHIKNLRKKLMDKGAPDYLRTRYGAGYVFSVQP